MSRPRRIGLINQGGADWIGGSEYIRNLVLALGQLSAEERAGFEFCLISGHPLEPRLAAQLQPHLARIYDLSTALPAPTLARQVRWAAERRFAGKTSPRFSDFIAAEGFDFLYPLTYDNQFNIGVPLPLTPNLGTCRWAGWIPDFQHRFLPEFFAEKELKRRDAGIATLVAEAPALVFSSASAEADFRSFYPEQRVRTEVLRFATSPNPAWFEGTPEAVQKQFHLPDRFLLVSNQFWQHKDHRTAFEALALLRARGIIVDMVCTGQPSDFRNAAYFNSLLRCLHELGIASQAHHSMIYYGASLAALVALGQRKGYAFVGANTAGNNAFFVRRALKPDSLPERTAAEGFVACQFREARNQEGQLLFLSPAEEAARLAGLPVVEVEE